jgi:hypothetical protein
LGDATVVPVLLAAATQSDKRLADAARSTLAVLDSGEINAAIVDLLTSDNVRTRQMAIDPTAQRNIASAAPTLLELAKTSSEGKYQIRALRGYVRIARQLNMTPDERMTVCRNTLAVAQRSDDKALVLEVFRRYPTPEGLSLAATLLSDKDLQQPACSTIVSMAGRVATETPEQTEKALLPVLELSTDRSLQ